LLIVYLTQSRGLTRYVTSWMFDRP